MKLLLVEDNPTIRQMLRQFLADLAEQISECGDGADALAMYRVLQPDWVLMDIRLPGVNGLTATRQITAAFPAARVLIVTSFDDDGQRQAAQAAGACGYVLKENLLELRQWLQTELSQTTINPTDLPPAGKGTIR